MSFSPSSRYFIIFCGKKSYLFLMKRDCCGKYFLIIEEKRKGDRANRSHFLTGSTDFIAEIINKMFNQTKSRSFSR